MNQMRVLSMGFGVFCLAIVNLAPAQDQVGKEQLAAFEKEIKEHPGEALAIARRAVGILGSDEKKLYSLAAQEQQKILPSLGLAQLIELAEVLEKKLDDAQGGRRVRTDWLQQRGLGLSPPEVRQLLGPPQRIAYQLIYRQQIEQWAYDGSPKIWAVFIYTDNHVQRLQRVLSARLDK
jgi:hypothetical protein